jgi:DNA-binding NtrC family response regulator
MSPGLTSVPSTSDRWDACAPELLGQSDAVARVREQIARAASTDRSVLIVSEPGCDAESVARALHEQSAPTGAFLAIDCRQDGVGRLLFGSPAGRRIGDLEEIGPDGRLASARNGTVFLQDVGELPASVQAKLARLARDGEALIGGAAVDMACRLVAAASVAIDADAEAKRFRADLFRRLSGHRIDLPPLSERGEDVPELAVALVSQAASERSRAVPAFTDAALALLAALPWPGNLNELRTVVDRLVESVDGGVVQVEHLLPALRLKGTPSPFVPAGSLREARLRFERHYIAAVLQHHEWRLAEAAQTLGIQRPNLYRKARQLGLALTRITD